MGKFMIATFLLLGVAFYEMSGGADFVPEERPVAVADAVVEEPAPAATVTRAVSTPLVQINTQPSPLITVQPAVAVSEEPAVTAEPVALTEDIAEPAAEEPAAIEVAAAPAPSTDIRFVGSSRVNMRAGPGTNYSVLDTLDGGTELEVLEVDATGWARVYVPSAGIEGFMAERLLTR